MHTPAHASEHVHRIAAPRQRTSSLVDPVDPGLLLIPATHQRIDATTHGWLSKDRQRSECQAGLETV